MSSIGRKPIDPFHDKITMSTGSKTQRYRFAAGSVKTLKNEFKTLGVNLVHRNQADYVIVPDGMPKYVVQLNAIPIYYSEFVEMLQSSRPLKTTKKAKLSKKSQRTEIPIFDDEVDYDREFLEENMKRLL